MADPLTCVKDSFSWSVSAGLTGSGAGGTSGNTAGGAEAGVEKAGERLDSGGAAAVAEDRRELSERVFEGTALRKTSRRKTRKQIFESSGAPSRCGC